jgi:competence protein ComEC
VRAPLVAPLAAIASGILVSRSLPFGPGEVLIYIAAFSFLYLGCRWRGLRRLGKFCGLAAIFAFGIRTELGHRPGPRPELDVEGRDRVILSGCVVEPPAYSAGKEQFTIELEPRARARVNLYLKEGTAPPALRYGQRVEVTGRVRKPRNFGNPRAFDYAGYLARQDLYWTVSARAADPIRVLEGECGSRLWKAVYAVRGAALDRIDRLYAGRAYETGMMRALLIGDAAGLEKVWMADYRATGTVHALVISGSHVAVLAAFLMLVLRVCWVPRWLALLLTVALAWLYALVSGWQTPVIRSAAGLTLFMACGWFYRTRNPLNLLAAVAIAFLALDPPQLTEASFQLSFLAVAFLVAVAAPLLESTTAPLARGLSVGLDQTRPNAKTPARVSEFRVEMRLLAEAVALWTRLPAKWAAAAVAFPARAVFAVWALFATSAAVQAGLALPMVEYFHRASFTGLSANVFVVPLMGAIIPAGFVAVAAGWSLPAEFAALLLDASRRIVQIHSSWEPRWRVPDPPFWLAAAIAGALIAWAFAMAGSRRWGGLAGLCVGALLALMVWHPFPARLDPGKLEMTVVDVGQGDAIFVVFPDGKLLLMDGGGITTFRGGQAPRLDIGEDVVAPYLWTRSIRRIDFVALSHAHQDHIGGLAAILDGFEVGELWTGATQESPAWNALSAKARARGVPVRPLHRGDIRNIGGTSVEVLAPSADYAPGGQPRNNDSLALRLGYGRRSFLLTGDIERQVERELAAGGGLSHADVLKVAHHGSRTSSTTEMLDAVRPVFAVISAGYENSYGHPHPDILNRIWDHGAYVLRTDRLGLITIETDGQRLEVRANAWSGGAAGNLPAFER